MIQKRKNSKQVVVITIFDVETRLGRLCLQAAGELEQEGFGRVVRITELAADKKWKRRTGTERILVVDGTDHRGYSFLVQNGITPDHHLVAADLGIEEDDGEEVLQLLKDGMEAECALVDQVPSFPCSCCS